MAGGGVVLSAQYREFRPGLPFTPPAVFGQGVQVSEAPDSWPPT